MKISPLAPTEIIESFKHEKKSLQGYLRNSIPLQPFLESSPTYHFKLRLPHNCITRITYTEVQYHSN